MFRSTQFNNGTDFDLDMITEGLSARTYLSLDFYNGYYVSITNDFRTYEPTWEGDQITVLTPYGNVDRKDLTENVSTNYDKDSYRGFEIGMEYSKKLNDLTFNVGGNLMYTESEVVERDEVHENDYEYRTGKPTDAIFGLTNDDFYSKSDFTINQFGNYILDENLTASDCIKQN